MDRRVKLLIAAIALSLLVAGAVRRWTREGELPFSGHSVGRLHAHSEMADSAHEADATQPFVAHAGSWPHEGRRFVSPASTEPPAEEIAGREQAESRVMQTSFLPNPQPKAPAQPPAQVANAPTDQAPAEEPAAHGPSTSAAALAPQYPQTPHPDLPLAPPSLRDRYVIQQGDSFWSISERIYGTAKYFQALYEHNRRICPYPDRLPPGVTIETPPFHVLEQQYPSLLR